MALYPNAVQKPLNKSTTPMAAYNILCLHTMVGYLYSTDLYFRDASVFSHFGIGGIWGSDSTRNLDGVVYQWGDTKYRAAANLNGNSDVISIETADSAPQYASDIPAWTSKQCDAIVDLMVWANRTHNIPLELVPDTMPGRRGIAYHRQGIEPWVVDGGIHWSSVTGKPCPGDRRIAQIPGLISRAQAIVAGTNSIVEDLDFMPYYASKTDFEAAITRLVNAAVDARLDDKGQRLMAASFSGNANAAFPDSSRFANWNLVDQLAALKVAKPEDVAALKASIDALTVAINTLLTPPTTVK